MSNKIICPRCAYKFEDSRTEEEYLNGQQAPACPLCDGEWDIWELRLAPIPLEKNRTQIASWLGQIPFPSAVDLIATESGMRVRMFTPPGAAHGQMKAWASMTHQQTRWVHIGNGPLPVSTERYILRNATHVPSISLADRGGDPMLALSGYLLNHRMKEDCGIRLWFTGQDPGLQSKLQALVSYSYGTESGVDDKTPNPWGIRLTILRTFAVLGILTAGIFAGLTNAHWVNLIMGMVGILAGCILTVVSALGVLDWMGWRSIPKQILETKIEDILLKTTIVFHGSSLPDGLSLLTGTNTWIATDPKENEWPLIRSRTLTLSAADIATIVAPPEMSETSGVMASDVVQEIPAPPPSDVLLNAPFKVGTSVANDKLVGIEPDGHGVATGGSRSGKTSIAYQILSQLIEQGDEAPGIFLVDPHLSLADGLLQFIHELPPEQRQKAIQRLRIISPDQPEVVPLNLLTLPDFSWAGNSIVQVGQRIWDDYWGPRMQAALLALFKSAHAWNQQEKNLDKMGLLHVVFSAFNVKWRHATLGFLKPEDRVGILALDALLGEFGESNGRNQGWVTEVISPVLSKVMALELSPWLFSAMHQPKFVNFDKWIKDRSWIIMRLPTGEIGRESARLIASVVYNVFDAAYRKATALNPVPYYFFVDEAQEIGTGMRLEAMLSEGAKFGARMFVLSQSLAMMRKIDGMEAVVQSLLANTSTQAFFSPDPEDADTIRAILSSSHRYGDITLDLPSLQCWLRARVVMHWQPPTLAKIEPVKRSNPEVIQGVIREVIESHPGDYVLADDWVDGALEVIRKMIPPSAGMLLDELFTAERSHENLEKLQKEALREELIQKAVQTEKVAAEERGVDPDTVTRPDSKKREGKKNNEPIDENEAILGC
ncbi:MAG TPA: TraM recognition domain-containing protein [Anaerolineales bacterium]|nr:TraM recognition domain-containing protein [Anaerolineales bacterium]